MDWLRTVGKVIIFSLGGQKNALIYNQVLASRINSVAWSQEHCIYRLHISPVRVFAEDETEKTIAEIVDIDEKGRLITNIELYDEKHDRPCWVDAEGTVIDVYD